MNTKQTQTHLQNSSITIYTAYKTREHWKMHLDTSAGHILQLGQASVNPPVGGGLQLSRHGCLLSWSPPTSSRSLGGFTLNWPSCRFHKPYINIYFHCKSSNVDMLKSGRYLWCRYIFWWGAYISNAFPPRMPWCTYKLAQQNSFITIVFEMWFTFFLLSR